MRFRRVVGFSVDPSSIYSKINLDERKGFVLIKENHRWIGLKDFVFIKLMSSILGLLVNVITWHAH